MTQTQNAPPILSNGGKKTLAREASTGKQAGRSAPDVEEQNASQMTTG
jgi:hypothetical protein